MLATAPLVDRFNAALRRGDRASVTAAAGALLTSDAVIGELWKSVAKALEQTGESAAALAAVERWQREQPSSRMPRYEEALFLARASRHHDALRAIDRLPADFPSPAINAMLKGNLATIAGDADRAVAEFRRSVAANPRSGKAWRGLAQAAPLSAADEAALRAQRGIFAEIPDQRERAHFHSALGIAEDLRGNHQAAFAAFAEAARIMRALTPFDAAGDAAQTDDQLANWQDEPAAAVPATDPARPIFVTGLPRSGTTLVAQILTSHSQVEGGEELNRFRIISAEMGGLDRAAWDWYHGTGRSGQDLRELYHHLLAQRYPGDCRVVDKTLCASRYIGPLSRLFPDAPIIWVRRDPVDCAWSAFRTFFENGLRWSWSLADTAAFFDNEDRLFDHWSRALPKQILVVPYAELVEDPAGWTRRINAHAQLELEPAQLTPHLSALPVTTASATQVREPINRKGIGKAEPYVPFIGEFLERYGRDRDRSGPPSSE